MILILFLVLIPDPGGLQDLVIVGGDDHGVLLVADHELALGGVLAGGGHVGHIPDVALVNHGGILDHAVHVQSAVLQQDHIGGLGAALEVQLIGAVGVHAVGVGHHVSVAVLLVELVLIVLLADLDGLGGAILEDHVQLQGLGGQSVGGQNQQPILGVGGGGGIEDDDLGQLGGLIGLAVGLLQHGIELGQSAGLHIAHLVPADGHAVIVGILVVEGHGVLVDGVGLIHTSVAAAGQLNVAVAVLVGIGPLAVRIGTNLVLSVGGLVARAKDLILFSGGVVGDVHDVAGSRCPPGCRSCRPQSRAYRSRGRSGPGRW